MKIIFYLFSSILVLLLNSCGTKTCECTYSDGSVEEYEVSKNEDCGHYSMSSIGGSVTCVEK